MARATSASIKRGAFGVCALASARQTARALTQLYDRHLGPCGVESAQFALMMMLDAAPGRTQTSLGKIVGMDKTTLSRNLKLLRTRGWVQSVSASDARERRVSLSAAGKLQLAVAMPAWKRAQKALRRQMNAREWDTMWSIMQVTARAANNAIERSPED